MKDYLIIDIETIVAPDADLFMPEFKEPKLTKDGKPYANQCTVEEQKQAWLEGCALRPLTGQVAVVGINCNGKIEQYLMGDCKLGGLYEDLENGLVEWKSEKWLINGINKDIEDKLKRGYCIIGFNLKAFDLPFLSVRGSKYGIKPAWHYQDRYNTQILDIAEWFKQGVYDWKYNKCNDVFKFYGLGEKLADGSEFGKLWATDKQKALDYNRDELIKLEKVAKLIYG